MSVSQNVLEKYPCPPFILLPLLPYNPLCIILFQFSLLRFLLNNFIYPMNLLVESIYCISLCFEILTCPVATLDGWISSMHKEISEFFVQLGFIIKPQFGTLGILNPMEKLLMTTNRQTTVHTNWVVAPKNLFLGVGGCHSEGTSVIVLPFVGHLPCKGRCGFDSWYPVWSMSLPRVVLENGTSSKP